MSAATARKPCVALLESHSLGAALVVLDRVEKSALVQVLQAELNDAYGLFLKLTGDAAAVRIAVDCARELTQTMQVALTADVLTPSVRAVAENERLSTTLRNSDNPCKRFMARSHCER